MIGRRTARLALFAGVGVLGVCARARAAERDAKLNEVPGIGSVMPLRFTTFGDFYYAASNVEKDDFHIGTLELDVSLPLNDYVDVAAGLTFDGKAGTFGLGSFTIDCGIAGKGSHFLFRSGWLERSGIVFGKFDVPFGIAYLEYPSPDNRLVTLPNVVRETHGGWNDVGVQLYAQAPRVNVIAYVVNGSGLDAATATAPGTSAAQPPSDTTLSTDDAFGGRLGLTLVDPFELGVSGASTERDGDFVSGIVGADLRSRPGPFDLRIEAIDRLTEATLGAHPVRGAYGRALYRLDRLFATARYGVVLEGEKLVDREVDAGFGITAFPKAEIRVVGAYDLETRAATYFFQLVGGSAWQPTGFRR